MSAGAARAQTRPQAHQHTGHGKHAKTCVNTRRLLHPFRREPSDSPRCSQQTQHKSHAPTNITPLWREQATQNTADAQNTAIEQHESGFDGLAKKIRERYAEAQKEAGRAAQERENEQFSPPVRSSQPKIPPPRGPEPIPTRKPAYQMRNTSEQEGPTLRVVRGLEQTNVRTPLAVEKPTLQKVELYLQKVDALTPKNANVSSEVEIHHQHPYLAELAEQYATRDDLRRAILNYEILGPPLALRDYVYCGATEAR